MKLNAFIFTLFNTDQPASRYILNAAGRILVVAIPTSIVLGILFPNVEDPDYLSLTSSIPRLFVMLVITAPLLETLIMWPVLALISLFTRVTWKMALVSALFWGFLHWLQSPLQGVIITWSFWVMSVCFIVWRRHSLARSYCYTAAIHALNNLVAFVLIAPLLMMEGTAGDSAPATASPGNYSIEIIGGKGNVTSTVSNMGNSAYIRTGEITLHSADGALYVNGQRLDVSDRHVSIDTSDPGNIMINGQPFAELIADQDRR